MNEKSARTPKILFTAGTLVCVFAAGVLSNYIGTFGPAALLGAVLLLIGAVVLQLLGNSGSAHNESSDQEHRASQAARSRAQAIAEMAGTLGASLDYNQVLEEVMQIGVTVLKDSVRHANLVGMVLLFKGSLLHVATARRLTQRDLSTAIPGQAGILARALQEAEPVFASECTKDPELGLFASFQPARSILVIPLRAAYQNYGLLVFGSLEQNAFSEDDVADLTALGTQATIALQNAVLYLNLRKEKERLVEVEEEARRNLARDLHDGPTQTISAIAMRVAYVRKMIEKGLPNVDAELEKVVELADKTTKEIRHMLFTLRPLVLETQGLAAALGQLRQKMKDTYDQNVVLQLQDNALDSLESRQQGTLFYVIEEAVNNARKHARAEHIYVNVFRHGNYLTVEIQDDGVGFDLQAVNTNYENRGSLGMVNMRERAEMIDGALEMTSTPGQGTKISILIPLAGSNGHPPRASDRQQRVSALRADTRSR